MKKLFFILLTAVLIISVSCQNKKSKEEANDATTETVQDDGWITLFDGTSIEGWRGVNKDTLPGAWTIVDGTIHCIESGLGEAGAINGGDILYDKKFSNFHLKLEWKIGEGGNSGIFYLGQEVEGDPIWRTAPEYQILDNEKHLDAMLGVDGNRQAGSLYDLLPAKPQNTKPAGEWNTCEILVYDGTVVHKQNGAAVVEYHLWTDHWNTMIANSKFPEYNPNWAEVAKEGYISLQDHGHDVWFRNIVIKEM
ncbi:MAG: DUF1080 domain-containing protein [Mariniphaga sp.]|nr:DUF1080 domain-containing protein [Mariniphaga sp.]